MFKSTQSKLARSGTLLLLCMLMLGTFAPKTAYARTAEQIFEKQKHHAKAGYRSAIYKLAEMYKDGYGTPRDLNKALELYKQAAAQSYQKANAKIVEVESMLASGKFQPSTTELRMIQIREEIEKLEQEYNRLKNSR